MKLVVFHNYNMGVQENQNCTVITMRMCGGRKRWSVDGGNHMAKFLYTKENNELEKAVNEKPIQVDIKNIILDGLEVLSGGKIPMKTGSGNKYYENFRKMYIDIGKVIAIFAVILVHLQLNGKAMNAKDIVVGVPVIDKIWYWFRYIVTSCSDTMFMLITGAVRLRKKDDGGYVDYKKNFKELFKIIFLFLVFQIPFYIYNHLKYGSEMSIINFLKITYSSYICNIYWYIPGFFIPFIIIYPLLKKFSYVANKNDCEYLIIVFLIFEFGINVIKNKFNVSSNISFNFFNYICIYPIMGDLLCNKYVDSEVNTKKLFIILVLAVLFWSLNDKYYIMNVYVSAIVLYLLRYIAIKTDDFAILRKKHIGKMIKFASSNAILFFLLHPYSLKLLFRVGNRFYSTSKGVFDILGVFIFWFLNFILCYLIIFIYKKLSKMVIDKFHIKSA